MRAPIPMVRDVGSGIESSTSLPPVRADIRSFGLGRSSASGQRSAEPAFVQEADHHR